MTIQEVPATYKVPPVTQDTRHQILETTQRIAYGRGVSAVRMDEVAHELGMSKRTLYAYFRSKEALLEAMLTAKYARHTSQFNELLDNKQLSYLSRLECLMRVGWQANRELSNAVLQDMRRKAPHLWVVYEQLHEAVVYRTLQQALAQGQQQGWLRENIRLDIFLDMFFDITGYEVKSNGLHQHSYSTRDMQDTFFLLVFSGILSEKARSK